MLTVACVFKESKIYNRSHVARLENMVAQYMSQPYRFVCIDDSPFPGWWGKISLFEPGRFKGRVLYLDLDVTVVDQLDDLADYPYPFAAIRDYQYPLRINSSVMAWDAGFADSVFNDFASSVMKRLHGDQNWIHEKVPAFHFPRAWCPSYKASVLPTGKVPEDARVIVFHGQPKSWGLPEGHLYKS